MIAKQPNNANARQMTQTRRMSWLWLWAILGVVLTLFLVSIWLIVAKDSNADAKLTKESSRHQRIKTVPVVTAALTRQEVTSVATNQTNEDAERERRRKMFSKMSPEEKIDYLRERIRDMPIPETPTNRLYATGLEQTMDWIFTCEVGNPPPLLPSMSLFDQMHLAEILIMDNPILDTDSDKAAESKEMMKVAKKEFIQFLKDGGNPDDFLPYYHGQLVAAHDEYTMARQSIVEIIRNEPDIAIDYIKEVNARLAEKGIKTVVIPKKMLDAFGIESEEFE